MVERKVCLGIGYRDGWSHRYDASTFREIHDSLEAEITAFFKKSVRDAWHVPMPPLEHASLIATQPVEAGIFETIDEHLALLNSVADQPNRFARGAMLSTECMQIDDHWIKIGAFELLEFGKRKFATGRTLNGRVSETVDLTLEARWVCSG